MESFADNTRASQKSNRGFLVVGWICAVLSLFLYPFLFGVVGVVSGILATRNNSRAGMILIVSSILLMGTGLISSVPLLKYAKHIFGF